MNVLWQFKLHRYINIYAYNKNNLYCLTFQFSTEEKQQFYNYEGLKKWIKGSL